MMTHANATVATLQAPAISPDIGPSGRVIPTDPAAMLTGREAAALLGLSVRTLESARVKKTDGPPYLKLFASVRYQRGALLDWAAARERRSTSDGAGAVR
jgi:hypothetical protein